jgi:octaprenyl-diphosphate synthase
MSEGELLQIEKARKLDITEAVYFDIIRQKTASLIASCCAVGVASVTQDPDLVEKARALGESVGMAFQIKDDLFDYGEDEIGKPLGIDIKEKKMTLPLIRALSQANGSTKRRIKYIIKNQSHKTKKVKEVIEFVKSTDGLTYTEKVMNDYYMEALNLLDEFPDSEYRTSLKNLITFTIERKK